MSQSGSRLPSPRRSHSHGLASPRPRVSSSIDQSLPIPRSAPVRSLSADRGVTQSNEHSPLLWPRTSQDGAVPDDHRPTGLDEQQHDDSQATKSTLYLMILVLGIGGLQIAWCVELANGTPYLLSLGLSKSLMALVWIAGPLSGTLVQPYVGILSDNSRIRWGKRKPFMIGGTLATIISLLALAWTRELCRGLLGFFGVDSNSHGVKTLIMVVAVVFVYVLDFAINTVQAAIRAFIVDCAPTHQQESANAWASRATGVGNIFGYLAGYINLTKIVPFFGNTQFKVLCVIACLALGITVAISCRYIEERDPRLEGVPVESKSGVLGFFRRVLSSVKRLPPQIRAICEVQFFAWIGWFPFLFYITTYIGQLYVNPLFAAKPDMTPDEVDDAWEHATRIGTFALLVFAFTSFGANILLPFVVAPSFASNDPARSSSNTMPGLEKLIIPGLTLRRTWIISLVMYALTLLMTFFISTPAGGTVLVGAIGIPWAVTLWAPFALISAEISKRDTIRRGQHWMPGVTTIDDDCEDQAGIVLGLHNVAIAAPQIIATLGSSAIFRLLQKPRGAAGDDSVGWVLRAGAIASFVAAYFATRVGEERDVEVIKSARDEEQGGTSEATGSMRGVIH